MQTGILYALGATVLFGLADVVYKHALAIGTRAHRLMMLQSWLFLANVILYGAATGTLHFVRGSLWGLCVGLFAWAGFYNFARSMRTGAVSTCAPIFRLSFIITAALAILILHEAASLLKLTGMGLAVIAVFLLVGNVRGRSTPADRHSLMLVAGATVSMGIASLFYKFGLYAGATPASMMVPQAVVVVTCSTTVGLAVDRGFRLSGPVLIYAPVAAVLLALAFVLMVEGLARADASSVVPVAQMGMAVSAIIGFVFLGEPPTAHKIAGLLLAVASLGCFAFG